MRSWTIENAGTPLHGLWSDGVGEPIIVLPGAMADAEAFRPVVEAMERPEPVVVVNRRGRASSGSLGEHYSVETEVSDLTAWIDHLGTPVSVIGWSFGATIAIETHARDDRITHVVGYEPVLGPFGVHALDALLEADLDRRVEIVNIDVSLLPREDVEALRHSPAWADLRRLAEPLPAELAALNKLRPSEDWEKLAPELLVGEHSQHTEPYGPAFQRVADRLPLARTTVLPGHGHLAHAQNPEALGQHLASLLRRDS